MGAGGGWAIGVWVIDLAYSVAVKSLIGKSALESAAGSFRHVGRSEAMFVSILFCNLCT